MDFEAWRCTHNDNLFCPPEGCAKSYGCARDKGWKPGMPTPDGCDGRYRIVREDNAASEKKEPPKRPQV